MKMTDSQPDSSHDLMAHVDDFKSGRVSATDRVEKAIARIDEVDPTINAFHDLLADEVTVRGRTLPV